MSHRRVLYLDIDGVLATTASYRRAGWSPGDGPSAALLHPPCVAQLAELLRRSGARVVLSTSWRIHQETWGILREAVEGIKIVGATPRLDAVPLRERREHEIRADMAARGAVLGDVVILEDQERMGALEGRTVRLPRSALLGLRPSHVRRALQLWGCS